jgi:DNA-binding response OmpR family regulator
MIQNALKALPANCVVAENVLKAARIIQRDSRPAIVLLDLSVPHALTFLKELKTYNKYTDLPVLAITDKPDSEQIKLALEAGADRWLTAGFIRTTLSNVIRQLTSKVSEQS